MKWERGDVVVAIDPFRDDETACRPFVIISTQTTPFQGQQFIGLSLTTRTWYEDRIPLVSGDWVAGGGPESSAVMPWSVNSVRDEWIDYRQGSLRRDVVEQAVGELIQYIR